MVEIKGDKVIITLPRINRPSNSGKTTLIACTNGAMATTFQVDGKPVTLNVNAYIK